MNAIEFLLKEHEKVRQTFKEISKTNHRHATKIEMFNDLCQELLIHETMEQKVWYPNFKNDEKLDETVKHLIKEEKTAEKTIQEFAKIKTEKEWEEKFTKFKKDVEHHASEEETKLFPKVEKLLDKAELERIGKEMREFKNEFAAKM